MLALARAIPATMASRRWTTTLEGIMAGAGAFRAYFKALIAIGKPLSVFSGPPTQTILPLASATKVAGMSLTR